MNSPYEQLAAEYEIPRNVTIHMSERDAEVFLRRRRRNDRARYQTHCPEHSGAPDEAPADEDMHRYWDTVKALHQPPPEDLAPRHLAIYDTTRTIGQMSSESADDMRRAYENYQEYRRAHSAQRLK